MLPAASRGAILAGSGAIESISHGTLFLCRWASSVLLPRGVRCAAERPKTTGPARGQCSGLIRVYVAVNVLGPHRVVGPESLKVVSGGVLLSHTLPCAVPSALWVLASGFGMGPGVSPTL